MYYHGRGDILDHLICLGFRSEYLVWVYHGEGTTATSSGTVHNAEEDLFDHDMYEMLNDVFQPKLDGTGVETHEATLNSGQEAENGGRTFDNIVKEVEEKLYPNCKYNKRMGRRKRLCITSTDIPIDSEVHDQSSEFSATDIPTEGDQSSHPQTTGGQSTAEEHNSTEGSQSGAQKKVRGYTQKTETWNMSSSQKIVVTFNRFGKPVGDEGNELVQYLGTLVRMANHVRIDYDDWRKIPIQKKGDMYSMVKAKFVIHPAETSEIKKWILFSMGKKWRTWKGSLKARAYDSSLTIDQIVAQQTEKDNRVNPTQFKKLVTHWFTLECQRMCDLRRKSRAKMEEPHVSGTKSFARLAHEEALKNGVYPTRGQIYVKTRTHKNGNIVNEKVAQVMTSLQAIVSDSSNTQGSSALGFVDDFSNDDYSKVKGPEKRGYIRCVGRMPTVKEKVVSCSNDPSVEQLKTMVNVMMPGSTSTIPHNSNSVNQRASSESHHNDGNC
ncbi:unnamed protein product [Lactuca saligna]|uniref:Uncharacterized protein n=1 Tax=Lactuca saligna TaxID=75948 RepID=A0AA36E7U8_LACSI|nr:unnamed protein product [Lactuca saligna]